MAQQKAVGGPAEGDAAAQAFEPAEDMEDLVDELAPGTRLLKGQYTILRFINSGGFGITYLAKDSLDRDVVIKECFPSAFCRRSKAIVSARSRAHQAELRSIVQLFLREARSLAKIVHPNIVAVHQVFEDNGTAYMAIDYINGLDLQQILEGQGRMPKPDEIVLLTEKLLAAVGFIHAHDMLHRDISPDNILLDTRGEPILIDFGAAREQASQTTRAMSALRVVKDGYSPQEFYVAGSEQGPWSDLYALAATLYHLISGEAPINGQARLAALAEEQSDPYVALAGRFEGYPAGFLEAIDKAMATLPKHRVQSAQDWLSMFRPGILLPLAASDDIAAAVHSMVVNSRLDQVAVAQQAAAPFGAPPQPARQVSKPPRAIEIISEDPPKSAAAHPVVTAVAPEAPAPRPPRRGIGAVQLAAGVMLALAIVGIVVTLLGVGVSPVPTEVAAPAPAETAETEVADIAAAGVAVAESAITLPAVGLLDAPAAVAPAETPAEAPAERAAAAPEAPPPAPVEPSAEPAPVIEPPATTEPPAAAEPPATAEPPVVAEPPATAEPPVVAEPPAAVEPPEVVPDAAPMPGTAVAEAAAPVADPVPVTDLRANQITFAAWDVAMPFLAENRLIGGERLAVISRVLPSTDLSVVGDWLAPGLLLYTVNGADIQQSGNVTAAVLNAMQVDPDGRARVVVEYSGAALERQAGLLTVDVVRLISLANGLNVTFRNRDGVWQAEVTAVLDPSLTDLRQGDILFRDRTTGVALAQPETLEAILVSLVEAGVGTTEFSIIRDNRVEAATMQLARAADP